MPVRRADRLLEILQLFRGGRLWTARRLADVLQVNERTVYRDIDTLVRTGTPIRGKPGQGFSLSEQIFLPPMNLTEDEYDALRLGMSIVSQLGDDLLAKAATELVIKLEEVLPEKRKDQFPSPAHTSYLELSHINEALKAIRTGIRDQQKLLIVYEDVNANLTERVIRPLQLEFWGKVWTVATWCELRQEFRVFRVDRITKVILMNVGYEDQPGMTFEDLLDKYESEHSEVD